MNGNEHDFLYFIFEFSLFIIFLYYLWLLIAEHVIPTLKEQMAVFVQLLSDLRSQKKTLVEQRQVLEAVVQFQHNKLVSIEEKMEKWHQAMLKNQEKLEIATQARMQQFIKKKKYQAERSLFIFMSRNVIPSALKDTRDKLTQQYEGSKGKAHLIKLINDLAQEQ